MVDRTTKALLLAIALGLWMNVMGSWMRPRPIQAAQSQEGLSLTYLMQIHGYVNGIANGLCLNSKICDRASRTGAYG